MEAENKEMIDAAYEWFEYMPFEYRYNFRHKSTLGIVDLWIEQVVREWWWREKGYFNSALASDEDMAIIYLKEHKNKEESPPVEKAALHYASGDFDRYSKTCLNISEGDVHRIVRMGFKEGANWQKEQDRLLIFKLSDALRECAQCLEHSIKECDMALNAIKDVQFFENKR